MHFFQKKALKNLHSSKSRRTFASLFRQKHGCLAQLVQSICLTSRGSAVRIRQHPPGKRWYRLVAQDAGLSRRKPGFDSPYHYQETVCYKSSKLFFFWIGGTRSG